jgi:S1-C subfamily serine protease
MEQGFQVADVILELNGEKVDTVDDLLGLYNTINSGNSFRVKVFRGQREVELTGEKVL